MANSNPQLDHLKSLVSQLQEKIAKLEGQANAAAGSAIETAKEAGHELKEKVLGAATPAQHLRMVLMGPPGAGECNPMERWAEVEVACERGWSEGSLKAGTTRAAEERGC